MFVRDRGAASVTALTFLDLRRVATLLDYQRRGIGSRLLQWGVDVADNEGLYAWLHARPAGLRMYAKAGWTPVVSFEFSIPGIEVGPVTSMIRKPVASRKGKL